MPVRTQRTHIMGYSNRNPSNFIKQGTDKLFQRSFIKSKSQYHPPTNNTFTFTNNNSKLQPIMNTQKLNHTFSNISNSNDFNGLYINSQKGHHYQFDTQRFNSSAKRPYMYKKYKPAPIPLALDFKSKLNSSLSQQLQHIQSKQISMFKIKQLKQTFLRNNRNRRNLSQFFSKYANSQGLIDEKGFEKLIKEYGFDINNKQVDVIFKLNKMHRNKQNIQKDSSNLLNLNDFVNLMTKQNVYFRTLNVKGQGKNGYRFSDPHFQIFRNKFSKLKQSLKIYQNQTINLEIFQKIMKKLDITDLVIKQNKRQQIFNQFINQNGALNVQKLLGTIAVQENQRVSMSDKQFKSENSLAFNDNLKVKQEYDYQKQQNDSLNNQLCPFNLKKSSVCEYEKHLRSAKEICQKLKLIKQKSGKDVVSQIFSSLTQNKNITNKQIVYMNVQRILQSFGYNFNKNQYKAFLSYLDFDSVNQIAKKDFQKFVFNENQKEIIDRLDRRKRSPQINKQPILNNNSLENQEQSELNNTQFYEIPDKSRSKSCTNWLTTKKSFIKEANIHEFKVPTKFSAWPQRLYQTDLSMIQPKHSTGMGISEFDRFSKNQKHTFGQQEKQKKNRIYENKVRKTAEWQNNLLNRVQVSSKIQEEKQLSKNYNLRLLKEQYQNRCHSNAQH